MIPDWGAGIPPASWPKKTKQNRNNIETFNKNFKKWPTSKTKTKPKNLKKRMLGEGDLFRSIICKYTESVCCTDQKTF